MLNKKQFRYKTFFTALIAIIISASFSVQINAQVSGISGAKLCVPDAGALPVGSFEFEPSFSVFSSANRFCESGKTEGLGGENITSSVMFRLTAGVTEGLEVGTAFSSTIEQISFGGKYIFTDLAKFNLAFIGGLSLPAGNKFVADTLVDNEHHLMSSFGTIASLELADYSSLDFIFSYTRIHGVHPFNNILNYGIGVGDWFTEKFQGVVEVNGFSTYNGKLQSHKLSVNPGVTYKTSDRLLFVFGFQFDLFGKNEDKGYAYYSAFTITL